MGEERKKLAEFLEELLEEIRNAKTEEETKVLKKKAEAVEELIEAYEGDKDLEKIAVLMEKIGPMVEDILGPLKELLNELYSPDRVQTMGKSVAEFYKSLIEAGMDKEAALELTKEYMDSVNPGKSIMEMLSNLVRKGGISIHGPTKYYGKKEKKPEGEDEGE